MTAAGEVVLTVWTVGGAGFTTAAAAGGGGGVLELAAAGFSSGIGLGIFLLAPNVIEGRGGVLIAAGF